MPKPGKTVSQRPALQKPVPRKALTPPAVPKPVVPQIVRFDLDIAKAMGFESTYALTDATDLIAIGVKLSKHDRELLVKIIARLFKEALG